MPPPDHLDAGDLSHVSGIGQCREPRYRAHAPALPQRDRLPRPNPQHTVSQHEAERYGRKSRAVSAAGASSAWAPESMSSGRPMEGDRGESGKPERERQRGGVVGLTPGASEAVGPPRAPLALWISRPFARSSGRTASYPVPVHRVSPHCRASLGRRVVVAPAAGCPASPGSGAQVDSFRAGRSSPLACQPRDVSRPRPGPNQRMPRTTRRAAEPDGIDTLRTGARSVSRRGYGRSRRSVRPPPRPARCSCAPRGSPRAAGRIRTA